MKFTTPSNLLHERFTTVSRVIGGKIQLSIMESVLFEVKGDALHLTATDGETRIICEMPIEDKSGDDVSFTVKARQLLDPLREISNQTITFELNEEEMIVEVNYSNGNFSFPVQSGEDFPEPEALSDQSYTLTIPSATFLQGIESSIYATSNEDIRPLMMGLHLDIRPDCITFVGTDGFLMASYRNYNIKGQVEERNSFTLQKKPANLLRGILTQEGDAEPLEIQVYYNFATFSIGTTELQCRLLEGKYPNYESVIPDGNNKVVEADRMQLLGAFRRVSMFASQPMNLVRLEIESKSMKLLAKDNDFSTSAEETIPCSFSEDKPLTISFRGEHYVNVLGTMIGEMVTIKLGDRAHAALISPSGAPEGVEMLVAIMPLVYQ
ncbi:MAG: DNA polymerase III subunit beta [Porphyromonas sp.]|nr:DNA polymerase III subunit beta [Porphyromonas sp.]